MIRTPPPGITLRGPSDRASSLESRRGDGPTCQQQAAPGLTGDCRPVVGPMQDEKGKDVVRRCCTGRGCWGCWEGRSVALGRGGGDCWWATSGGSVVWGAVFRSCARLRRRTIAFCHTQNSIIAGDATITPTPPTAAHRSTRGRDPTEIGVMITAERRLLAALNQPAIHSPTPSPTATSLSPSLPAAPASWSPSLPAAPASWGLSLAAAPESWNPSKPAASLTSLDLSKFKNQATDTTRQRGAARAIAACCVEHLPVPQSDGRTSVALRRVRQSIFSLTRTKRTPRLAPPGG